MRVRGAETWLELASPSGEAQLTLLCPRDRRWPELGALSAIRFEGVPDQDFHIEVEVPRSVARPQKALGYEGGRTVESKVLHRGELSVIQVTTRPGRPFYICGIDRSLPVKVTDSLPGFPVRIRTIPGGRGRVHGLVLDHP